MYYFSLCQVNSSKPHRELNKTPQKRVLDGSNLNNESRRSLEELQKKTQELLNFEISSTSDDSNDARNLVSSRNKHPEKNSLVHKTTKRHKSNLMNSPTILKSRNIVEKVKSSNNIKNTESPKRRAESKLLVNKSIKNHIKPKDSSLESFFEPTRKTEVIHAR